MFLVILHAFLSKSSKRIQLNNPNCWQNNYSELSCLHHRTPTPSNKLTLDKCLPFEAHKNDYCTKLTRPVGILYKLKSFLPETILKNLCCSLVHWCINYIIESWFLAVLNFPYNGDTSYFFSKTISSSSWTYFINLLHHFQSLTTKIIGQFIVTLNISICISFNSVDNEYQTRTNGNLSVVRFNRTAYQSSCA